MKRSKVRAADFSPDSYQRGPVCAFWLNTHSVPENTKDIWLSSLPPSSDDIQSVPLTALCETPF